MRYPKEISVKVYQGLLYTRLRVLILRWEMTQVIFFSKNSFQTDQPNNRHAPPSIIVHGPPPGKY